MVDYFSQPMYAQRLRPGERWVNRAHGSRVTITAVKGILVRYREGRAKEREVTGRAFLNAYRPAAAPRSKEIPA